MMTQTFAQNVKNIVMFGKTMKSEKARFEFDARLADQRVKHCLICSVCWEAPNSKKKRQVMRTNYYENFPSYGKPKETCPKCKESITQ